jgi:hypothetical protein
MLAFVKRFISDGGMSEIKSANVSDLVKIKKMQENAPQEEGVESVSTIGTEGLKEPLILIRDKDGNMRLQQGHHRLEEAIKLGATKLPVVVVEAPKQKVGEKDVETGEIMRQKLSNALPIKLENFNPEKVSGLKYEETSRTEDYEDGEHKVGVYDLKRGDENIGEAEIHEYKDKGHRFSYIDINKELRNKGIGKEVYRDANRRSLKESGHPLWAKKKDLNANSERVWDSLIKSGEAVKKGDIYTFKDEAIQEPVESIKPSETSNEGGEPPITVEETATEPGEIEKRTGIKNAVSEGTRSVLELPKVEVPKLGTDHVVLKEGKDLVDSGDIDPQQVVNRINSTDQHNMSRNESKAMQYYMHQLSQHETEIREQLSQATDPEVKASYVGLLGQLSDLQDAATEANIKSGKDWSDVGNIRQILVDQSFNPSREKAIIKDNYGGEVPKDVQLKIDSALKERDEAINQRNKVEEQLREKEAALKIAEMQKESKKAKTPKGDYKAKRESLIEELKKAKEEHEKWLRDQGIQKSGIGFTLTGKMVKIMGEYAATYVEQGIEKASEIINKVYEDVKAHLPGISRNDVRDGIALYQAGKLDKKAEGMEAKIKEGVPDDITKLKMKFQNHTDWVKANQRVANADYKIKNIKRQSFDSKKNFYQRSLKWAGKLFRASVLSGYNVLYKLAAAATIGGAGKRIPEQMIGGIYSQIFKGVAEKAPIEGYFNAKSEAKFYTEFFNPKKFITNTWQIVKGNESDLTRKHSHAEYGKSGKIPLPDKTPEPLKKTASIAGKVLERVISLPTDLHQVLKDPVKRATFEAAFRNAMIWAEKNGLDISDPLVVNTLETAAYKRANYEIFMEQNWLSRKFSEVKTKMEKAGNFGATGKFVADFMIPVSTVPTNIVRRLVTTSPLGLIRGGGKVAEAYYKGIENLTTEQADAVMKQLKQGTLGTALWLIGWLGASQFGGLYSKYNPDKERKEGDLAHDEMEVGGKMLPKPVQHALPLEIIQWAATARHIYDNYKDNKNEGTFTSILNAGLGSIGALTEQIPVVETATHTIGAFKNPYEGEKLKEDVTRRFQPQILRETGIIKKEEKKPAAKKSKPGKPNKKAKK